MPGRVFRKSSTAAIRVRIAHENPPGVTAGQAAGAAGEGLASVGEGCCVGRADAGLAPAELALNAGIEPQPDMAHAPSRQVATASAAARPFQDSTARHRTTERKCTASEHTERRSIAGADRLSAPSVDSGR